MREESLLWLEPCRERRMCQLPLRCADPACDPTNVSNGRADALVFGTSDM